MQQQLALIWWGEEEEEEEKLTQKTKSFQQWEKSQTPKNISNQTNPFILEREFQKDRTKTSQSNQKYQIISFLNYLQLIHCSI